MSCYDRPGRYTADDLSRVATVKDSVSDNIERTIIDEVFGDTLGLYQSPINVKSFKIIKSESGNYRNVKLTYKNNSMKTVTAIKFRWKGLNAFDEPADLGSAFADGYGSGFTDVILKQGKSQTSVWPVLSRDAKELTLAWVTEVVYEDGSKWKLNFH